MNHKPVALLVSGLLSACAMQVNPDQVPSLSNDALCAGYYQAVRHGSAEAHEREIKARQLLSDRDWDAVHRKVVSIGISKCALYASWGSPTRENRSVGSWGVHIQHVYGSRQYVYTRNGFVTSWQQ